MTTLRAALWLFFLAFYAAQSVDRDGWSSALYLAFAAIAAFIAADQLRKRP